MKEFLGLFLPNNIENNLAILALLSQFQALIPSHFSKARFIVAPVMTNFPHVIRADCSDSSCRVRACTHVVRNEIGILQFELQPVKVDFDRTDQCCGKCSALIFE